MTVYHFTRTTRPRFVQVWLDEWPESEYDTAAMLQHRLAVTGVQPVGVPRVAVEWRTPSCEPSSYGLLGAEYLADPEVKDLLIEIAVSRDVPYCWREAHMPTRHRGLTEEYSQSVLDGLRRDDGLAPVGPGRLRVSCAAHDVIGSSNAVFGWLAHAIQRLLLLDRSDISEDELLRLLDFE